MSPYCPVCTLLCRCSKCVRKLKAVAGIFQDAMESQGTTLEGTQFENILSTCRTVVGNTKGVRLSAGVRMRNSDVSLERVETPPTTKASSGKASNVRLKRVGTGLGVEHLQLLVPKPPLSEFPREIYGSLELEPGTPEDYLRVYSARGSYLSDDFPSVWSEQQIKAGDLDSVSVSNGQLVEDGNVDFCQICRNHGNLLCCDFCPRAFHVDCLDDGGHSISEERWECITCKSEKADMPEDQVDVKKSMDVISSSFGAKVEIDMDSKEIEALSAIHAMILRLIEYDFGYMFAVPVDVEAVPGYKETVEKPMDLGTICEKLSSGGYVDTLSDEITWESVLVTVLQDVELVWHNCFLFNFDGSAIYRMAAVQRRRALAIQKRSFDHLLSDDVKSEVNRFVRSCEVARGQLNAATSSSSTGNETEKALRSQRPKGKHKITVKVAKPSVNRPVAIFDQVSGRIVKIYSSMKSASHAAHSLISLGHRCEWPSTQDLVKQVVAKSASDPSIFLFGYRWLMLDELREGKVTFHEPLITGIQLQHQGGVYTFLSVDEAVSFPLLDKNERIDNLRMQLMTLEPGGEWIHIGGVMWRSLAPPGIKSRSGSPSELDDPQSTPVEGGTEDCSSTMEASFLASSAIIKEDLITKRKLVGFGSVEDAFLDWLQTADFSPSFPPLEAKTLDNFKIYFLDGDRNIDGLVWKAPPIPNAESNVTARDNTQLPVSTINGIALSPLIRSCDKKRPQEIDPIDGENQYEERQRKRDDDGHLTTGCSAINSAVENTRGPPLLGIQLFKQHSPRSDQPMKPENGQLSRSSKDVPAAASS